MNETLPDTLTAAMERHTLLLPADQIEQLDRYCRLLWDWNEKLNLTRHTDYDKFVARDLVDSLQLSRLIATGESVLDVGTGGGVPGIVLAITRPDLRVSLAESVQKKAQVVDEMIGQLGLNVAIFATRAENVLDDFHFDVLVARAVGPLWKMCHWFAPHWDSIGRLLAIKGPKWVEERGEARHRGYMKQLELRRVASYPMPGTDSESVILQISPKERSAAE